MTELKHCPTCGAPLPPGTPPQRCPRCLMRAGIASTGGAGASGAPASPPGIEELAPDFPQLELLELLGRGGMGAVYRARQKSLDRIVALKLLTVGADADPSFAERFEREARALASLSHPSIVAVYDSGRAGERYYLVMEYVDGTDLRHMERAGRIEPRDALAIVSQVCGALQYAHDRGVVHRDIKPENILVDRQGNVKIADFGLAKLLGRAADSYALTRSDQAMGTLHYMAPEQIEKPLTVDHRADIYSLGVVFYELLTGELPIGRFDPPSKKFQIDVRLDEVVLKTLEKDPPRRYQHASEVKVEVEGIASGPAAPAPAGHGGFRERHGGSTWPLWVTGLGSVAAAAIGVLAFRFIGSGGMTPHPSARGLLLVGLLLAGVLGIAFLVLIALFVGRRLSASRSPGVWMFVVIIGLLVLVPVGCGVLALGLAYQGTQAEPDRLEHLEAEPQEPFVYDVFGEPVKEPGSEPVPAEAPESLEPDSPAPEDEPR